MALTLLIIVTSIFQIFGMTVRVFVNMQAILVILLDTARIVPTHQVHFISFHSLCTVTPSAKGAVITTNKNT